MSQVFFPEIRSMRVLWNVIMSLSRNETSSAHENDIRGEKKHSISIPQCKNLYVITNQDFKVSTTSGCPKVRFSTQELEF